MFAGNACTRSEGITTLPWWSGFSTPGRATDAKQAEGKRQVKFGPLVLQVGGWAEGKTLLLHKPEALCATRHEEDG